MYDGMNALRAILTFSVYVTLVGNWLEKSNFY